MIHFVYADQLDAFPRLKDTMFLDRAEQFKKRHGWDVEIDENGYEVDQYDALNPLYAIWELEDGSHGGSIRVLPTVGRTMVNEHFTHLIDGVKIISPTIWECTRYCISPHLETGRHGEVAAALMLAGCELGVRFGLTYSIGIVYAHTLSIYNRIGWMPEVIGREGEGREEIVAALWPITAESKASICRKSHMKAKDVERWFDASFPTFTQRLAIAA